VFEQNGAALVRVEHGKQKTRWSTGFVIGARGEVVFGIDKIPKPDLLVELANGKTLTAELLGYDLGLSLAVARVKEPHSWTPLKVTERGSLQRRSWVIAMTHDARGRAQPYAGVVEGERVRDAKRKTPVAVWVVPVEAPGTLGSPVLSVDGELLGVVIEAGDRKTRVVPIEVIVPFVKAVVLGREAR
jgi:S1-C subfamily serine protease